MQMFLALALLQTPVPRDGLSVAADVSIVIVAVALVILALLGAVLLLRINGAVKEMRIGVRQNLGPVSDRARKISDNVEFITQALRTDVERLNASVKGLTDRLQRASEHMEERIQEFNALMEVVQAEAEDLFLDTASTVRGVRAGARSIGRSPGDAADTEEQSARGPDETRTVATEEA
jgi:hypothetical protein